MRVTWSWLREHLATDLSVGEISQALALSGTETHIERGDAWAQGFKVARIMEVQPHPNADTLRVCRVACRGKEYQVVCGAPNVREGMNVILSFPGCVLPGQKTPLAESTIRGVKSEGMMCSARELKLEGVLECPSEGIVALPDATSLEASLADLLPEDPVLHCEITPNRGDLFSVRGLARELAALGKGALLPYKCLDTLGLSSEELLRETGAVVWQEASVRVQTQECSRFATALVEGVRNQESGGLMARRLAAVGMKTISQCVDITNYVCHDVGRPLHVFDADRLQGPLVVRLSREGELFEGLDEQTYRLPEGLIVITDASGIISLAGVLGGLQSACRMDTTRILIESAAFDAGRIGLAGQKTHILSDARTRFERGVDPASTLVGLDLAARLVTAYGHGNCTGMWWSGEKDLPSGTPFLFKPASVAQKSGVHLSSSTMREALERLGCQVTENGEPSSTSTSASATATATTTTHHDQSHDTWLIKAPSWRFDVAQEVDAIEEILRVWGYEGIPSVPIPLKPARVRPVGDREDLSWRSRRALAAVGFFEVMTLGFMARKKARMFAPESLLDQLVIANPISQDLEVLRPSLLPNLLDSLAMHQSRALVSHPFFEIGPEFLGGRCGEQREVLAGVVPFDQEERWPRLREVTVFDVKGIVERLLRELGVLERVAEDYSGHGSLGEWYHPGRCGVHRDQKGMIAVWGEASPEILRRFDIRRGAGVGIFEIRLDEVARVCSQGQGEDLRLSEGLKGAASDAASAASEAAPGRKAFILPALNGVSRDLAFVMPEGASVGKFLEELRSVGGQEVTDIVVVDRFCGSEFGPGRYSLALRVTFQAWGKKSFTEEELHKLMDRLIRQALKNPAVELRGQWEGV